MKKKKQLVGKMIQMVMRVPVETDAEVQAIAKKECRSYASVARQAIVEWLGARRKTIKDARGDSHETKK
jgi:predicted transcriptional regulator